MKNCVIGFVFLLTSLFANGQGFEKALLSTMKAFHQSMVSSNRISINQHTDKALVYVHSNGWIENKTEFLKNLESGYLDYHSYKEDSINITMNNDLANVTFIADIDVTLDGKRADYHLKVLEVWVKKGKRWLLFARHAMK